MAQEMLEEAANGGTRAVARRRRVRAAGLDVIEEGGDRVRVENLERQLRQVPAIALCDELKQQLQGISVGTNGVGACPLWRDRYSTKKDSTSANSSRPAVRVIAAAAHVLESFACQSQQLRRRLQIHFCPNDVLVTEIRRQ